GGRGGRAAGDHGTGDHDRRAPQYQRISDLSKPGQNSHGESSFRYPKSAPDPLLVAAAVAGPQLDLRSVRGPGAGRVQAQAGLDAGDGAVGVDRPLLVGPAVTGPDVDLGAGAGALTAGVQAVH